MRQVAWDYLYPLLTLTSGSNVLYSYFHAFDANRVAIYQFDA